MICKVSGWGTTTANSEMYSEELMYQNVSIVEKDDCSNMFRRTRLGRHFKIHKSHLCAGGLKGIDACKGDGGSPLVCLPNGDKYYKLAGLVSWGIGCGEKLPGVYTNIANFVNWIRLEMEKNDVEEFISN